GAQSLLLFPSNVKLIFAKFGKKVQKAAKKYQKRTIFGKIGTKTPKNWHKWGGMAPNRGKRK
ncbi:MAG: hypothetical protein ACI4PY_05095, partial [Akkermansia muciniphila]